MMQLMRVLLPLSASGACISNAVPPGERKLLANPNGNTYPLGVWAANYAGSLAANTMAQILIEEIFGINTTFAYGAGTVDGFYGVMPCKKPTNPADRECDDEGVSANHVHLESWVLAYSRVWQDIQNRYPKGAPINLGNMGYNGATTTYISKSVIDEAKRAEGLPLQYYAFYNASWYDPSRYFDDPTSFDTQLLMPCNVSDMSLADVAVRHVQLTGDSDGVVMAGGAPVAMKCHGGQDGHWWLAPSCRANISACVPWNTGGTGWQVEAMMQRGVLLNIPLALSVAKDYSTYTQLPLSHPRMWMYWWTPDPTFLDLAPKPLVYPTFSRREHAAGLQTSAFEQVSIDTLVSSDLATLAPSVQIFLEQVFITLEQMNEVLLAQQTSGESWWNVTCEWLRSNEAQWRAWIPDETQCFAGFGLYDTEASVYTDSRVNATSKIICQACPSGTFSSPLTDSVGETYVCLPCGQGSSQPSGASLSCKPCKPGEYQDQEGASECKRCPISEYQDELGALACKSCPSSTTTLGPGSVGLTDCGCRALEINRNETGGFDCVMCGEGMTCPDLSKLVDLKRGQSALGDDYTPKVLQGYYSTQLDPLQVYRCGSVAACPGGTPDTCGGGLVGTPCSQCPEGATWTGSSCEDCAGWRQALWALAVLGIFVLLVLAYYLTTSKVTAKASVLFATTASFGMLVLSMQNLGLIGMMTVEWPKDLAGLFSICQFLLLDIDSYGFSCIAGQSAPMRYLLSALIFPVGILWLALCWAVSKLFPRKKWNGSKVVSCMGAFLQVGFSTMSATSLSPMMCYKHPNGQRSILKYPGVLCGSSDHTMMLVIGWLLLCIFVLGFVALCTFACFKVPAWSASRKDRLVASVRFLIFRFRFDSWWFGVPLLVRGPLLSLPVVLATDYPPVQIMSITAVMSAFLVLQMLSWPWKVPLLNLTDCIVTFCITLLVTTSSLFLPAVEGPMKDFAHAISTLMLSGIGAAMGIMCLMTASALIYRGAMGGKKELRIFNLGSVTNADKLAAKVKEMAGELERMEKEELADRISGLAVFDMNKITACITLLATEVAPPAEEAVSYKFNARINSSSFDISLKRRPQSKRSQRSSEGEKPQEKPDGNESECADRTLEELKSQWI